MKMVQPISATPGLKGKEAADFIMNLHRDSKKQTQLIPTPKLKKAQALIKKHGTNK